MMRNSNKSDVDSTLGTCRGSDELRVSQSCEVTDLRSDLTAVQLGLNNSWSVLVHPTFLSGMSVTS